MVTPFIIAEAGSCHDGREELAEELVTIAHACGANAVKFQFHSSAERVAERLHAPEAVETYRKYQMPREWLPKLSKQAHDRGMEFLCTVDLPEDIAVVAPFVDRFKIASWGATDEEFIIAHEKYEKPLVLSTGTLDADEAMWVRRGASDWLLHCVSAYPAPLTDLNLTVLRPHAMCLFQFDGFSDHSGDIIVGALAVAAGARILEVHFRAYETAEDNPDFPHAHAPHDLKRYIDLARLAHTAMGDGIKRVMPSEEKNLRHRYVR